MKTPEELRKMAEEVHEKEREAKRKIEQEQYEREKNDKARGRADAPIDFKHLMIKIEKEAAEGKTVFRYGYRGSHYGRECAKCVYELLKEAGFKIEWKYYPGVDRGYDAPSDPPESWIEIKI